MPKATSLVSFSGKRSIGSSEKRALARATEAEANVEEIRTALADILRVRHPWVEEDASLDSLMRTVRRLLAPQESLRTSITQAMAELVELRDRKFESD